MVSVFTEQDFLTCSGSRRFAKEMAAAAPFPDCQQAVLAAREIWFNKVDVNGWLESFAAHPAIGETTQQISQRCRDEQSTAMATVTDSLFQELVEWNARYREKYGFVFLICASGRSMPEILAELKKRYLNRPIVELEIAAQEEMKIIELRLAKLFKENSALSSPDAAQPPLLSTKPRGDARRTRPPITTHVLDTSRGSPASGIEVHLEMWKANQQYTTFNTRDSGEWVFQGSSVTDNDGRCGHLMSIVDYITPGIYRISFNTGKYVPTCFFPYVNIVFEIKESQKSEHFHIPLLLSPFSFSTYRGS